MGVEDLDFKTSKSWEQFAKENPLYIFIPEFAEDENGTEFLRGKGRSSIYRVINDSELLYECTECGGKIMMSVIAHPKFENSKLNYYDETIPYCPRCEKKPKPKGSVISSMHVGSYDPSSQ